MELHEVLAWCAKAMGYWFLFLAVLAIAVGTPVFVMRFYCEKDFRAKCKTNVIAAYRLSSHIITKTRKLLTYPRDLS